MINRIGTVLLLTSALITGCSMAHGDPEHPKKNPHPVQRYEVIATAKSPGPWDKVKGYISYEVVNPKCTPEDKFLGVHELPTGVSLDIEMTRISENTWRGYFYRDYLHDEDYYGLGVCNWNPGSVSAVFVAHGEKFSSGSVFDDFIHKEQQTEFFKKSEFLDTSLSGDGAWLTTPDDPEVLRKPEDFFPITVTVREVKQ